MGVYVLWFLLCIVGIGMSILSLITGNQRMPKVQVLCIVVGGVLLAATVALSVYDIQTKPAVDTYFMGMQVLPLLMYAWVTVNSVRQLRRYRNT